MHVLVTGTLVGTAWAVGASPDQRRLEWCRRTGHMEHRHVSEHLLCFAFAKAAIMLAPRCPVAEQTIYVYPLFGRATNARVILMIGESSLIPAWDGRKGKRERRSETEEREEDAHHTCRSDRMQTNENGKPPSPVSNYCTCRVELVYSQIEWICRAAAQLTQSTQLKFNSNSNSNQLGVDLESHWVPFDCNTTAPHYYATPCHTAFSYVF